MSTPKVSVVVPCYNVEKYLHQCLDSIVNQTLKEIEIICVNDGSKDSTLSIIEEYAAKDDRIKIIDKPNAGYGDSMNRGFDMATGEYIGIIESDDYAELDMFEKLYACAKKHDLDAVKSGFFFYWSKDGEKNVRYPIASHIMSHRTFCPTSDFKSKLEMVDFFNIKPSIWSAIYKKEFIRENNIRFNETPGASFQDTAFNFKVWTCAKRARLMEDCFLHYRQDNENSSVNNPGKVYCLCDEYEEIARWLDENPVKKGLVESLMVRLKFDGYCWNYERLTEPLQREFIQRFYKEFRGHKIDGSLKKDYFEWYRWSRVHQILKNPDDYHHSYITSAKETPKKAFNDSVASYPLTYNDDLPFVLRKLIGGFRCIRDHGFFYTVKRAFKKLLRRA